MAIKTPRWERVQCTPRFEAGLRGWKTEDRRLWRARKAVQIRSASYPWPERVPASEVCGSKRARSRPVWDPGFATYQVWPELSYYQTLLRKGLDGAKWGWICEVTRLVPDTWQVLYKWSLLVLLTGETQHMKKFNLRNQWTVINTLINIFCLSWILDLFYCYEDRLLNSFLNISCNIRILCIYGPQPHSLKEENPGKHRLFFSTFLECYIYFLLD